jgi:hypothetical protein
MHLQMVDAAAQIDDEVNVAHSVLCIEQLLSRKPTHCVMHDVLCIQMTCRGDVTHLHCGLQQHHSALQLFGVLQAPTPV